MVVSGYCGRLIRKESGGYHRSQKSTALLGDAVAQLSFPRVEAHLVIHKHTGAVTHSC
jgi:hypothetical protein